MTNFHYVESCCYEVGGTGYRVERMANGLWDAYKPVGHGLSFRGWESVRHRTRKDAATAVYEHLRCIGSKLK